MRVKQLGESILRETALAVTQNELSSVEINDAITEMQKILDCIQAISPENGNAIAAPQVGLGKRLIVLRIEGQFVTLVNPAISWASEDTNDSNEECFSFYQLRGVVERAAQVWVDYTDVVGHPQQLRLSGDAAALVQHEIDHLDGIFFLDKVADTTTVASVESVYAANPARLAQVRDMIAYMVG
ncbi:peptide deformylase [Neptunomonas sp. XY-337]|uniref:peptide deformylase n=1 Tax=Neptunomonas sp. XY-337 TaxID=2561897 RepID=UPI0010AA132D|nr:peptide deformylase [Neptunomonas sp. XY-337]